MGCNCAINDNHLGEYSRNETMYFFMVLENFTNLDRSLFAAEYNIITWRFMSSSSSKYWFMRIPKYRTLSQNFILVPERKIEAVEYTLINYLEGKTTQTVFFTVKEIL